MYKINVIYAINSILTWKGGVALHQARSVVVPSPEAAGPARGFDCLRVGRTTGRTADQGPVGRSPPLSSGFPNQTVFLLMFSDWSHLFLVDIFHLCQPGRNEN